MRNNIIFQDLVTKFDFLISMLEIGKALSR